MNKINAFKELFLIEKNIFSLYDKLSILELQGNKEEYLKIISYLKMVREVEDKLYDKDVLKLYSLNNFINDDVDLRRRISNRIDIEMDNKKLFINYYYDDVNISFFEDLFKIYNDLDKYYFYLLQDHKLLYFIKILQDEINNCSDLTIKFKLIFQKYRLIKLNPRLEKELLIYNFDIDKLIQFENEFFETTMDYNKWLEYEEISDVVYSMQYFKALVHILFMGYDKSNYKVKICYLSACLKTMSYGMLDEIKEHLNDILNSFKNDIVKDDITMIVYDASDKVLSVNSKMRKKKRI